MKPSGAEAIIGVYRNRAPLHFRRFNCDGDAKRLRVEIRAGGAESAAAVQPGGVWLTGVTSMSAAAGAP